MQQIKHFQSLASGYDAFLLDLWGVVHDGTQMYAGAKECLQRLHQLNKKVVMISNAPRRAAKAQVVLDQFGVGRELYQDIITSGEVAYQELSEGRMNDAKSYFFIGPARDADVLNGLKFEPTQRIADADFLLNVGFGSEQDTVDDVSESLNDARARNLPMLCLNPDMEVVKITGERFECAGVIAKQYEDRGGIVHYFGKPHGGIYDRAYALLGNVEKSKILAIGDGLYTDIQGANRFGLDSLLISGGILKGVLPENLAATNTPKYIADAWVW